MAKPREFVPLPSLSSLSDDALLELWQLTGVPELGIIGYVSLSRATIYRHMAVGIFPKPETITQYRTNRWRAKDIKEWQKNPEKYNQPSAQTIKELPTNKNDTVRKTNNITKEAPRLAIKSSPPSETIKTENTQNKSKPSMVIDSNATIKKEQDTDGTASNSTPAQKNIRQIQKVINGKLQTIKRIGSSVRVTVLDGRNKNK